MYLLAAAVVLGFSTSSLGLPLAANITGIARRINVEVLDPPTIGLVADIEKRSAPNTDSEIADPVSVARLVDSKKRSAPNTDIEILDPMSITRLTDFEKQAAPKTDIEMHDPACLTCQSTSPTFGNPPI